MADDQDGGRGPVHLGQRYEEVEPGLGRLHDAWEAGTGRPVLLLFPADHVTWRPAGHWDVQVLCQPRAPAITLRVARSPASPRMTELADILVLVTAAVQRVEDAPRSQAHLLEGKGRTPLPLRASPAALAAATLAGTVLGLSAWLFLSCAPGLTGYLGRDTTVEAIAQSDAPLWGNSRAPRQASLSYPLPAKPFRNQAVPPCKPKPIEFEINGGCWLELSQMPPCADVFTEYQGRCYLPVSKDRSEGRPPQATGP